MLIQLDVTARVVLTTCCFPLFLFLMLNTLEALVIIYDEISIMLLPVVEFNTLLSK